MSQRIDFHGRFVYPITSESGREHYHDHVDRDHKLIITPVFNGEAWGLATLTSPQVMVTEFLYNAVIPECRVGSMFFVQDKNTMKWGALGVKYPRINNRRQGEILMLKQIMPCIADEIYEDELMTDCSPTLFWMTCVGNKVGILTPYGFSKIIYDTYETDDSELSFRLIQTHKAQPQKLDYSFYKYKP